MIALIGPGVDRKDGKLKVTGGAKYAAEFAVPGVTHGCLVQSTIPKGTITGIDTAAAEAAPGVLAVITHKNALPRKKVPNLSAGGSASQSPGAHLELLDEKVWFYGQHVAFVVAETLEQARFASGLVKITYQAEEAVTDFRPHLKEAVVPHGGKAKDEEADTQRGDVKAALAAAPVKISHVYSTPHENHNPMEMHATIAQWTAEDKLTVWDSTQYISGVQEALAHAFSLKPDNIRVIDPFVGGGFGCKGTTWPHVSLTVMAAKMVGRPVRLMLTRKQMFTSVGYRSPTHQSITLAADPDGNLLASVHDVVAESAKYDEFCETAAIPTRMLYDSPAQSTSHRLVHIDTQLPTYMRAPGEATGVFALEVAMDELAYALKMDPLQLRLANYAESDQGKGLPFSSKSLRQCYQQAAERFAWDRRTPDPRSMQSDGQLVGYGMATATYPVMRFPAMAKVTIFADGHVLVQSGTQDLGTGTYTTMSLVAAEVLGLDPNQVRAELGDSSLPHASVSGGSSTTSSVCSAVLTAAEQLRDILAQGATKNADSPLHGVDPTSIQFIEGKLLSRDNPALAEPITTVVQRDSNGKLEVTAASKPGKEKKEFSMHAFGAVFVEVRVDPTLGMIRVPRIVAAYASGRILSAKTAHSQYLGGIVFGVGMALLEETVTDPAGRIVNGSLAEYLVPVNHDIGNIEILMVPEEDTHVNPIGTKGIGEIGIVGTPAAIANAVYHATGKRVRDLPITLDKLI